MPVAGCTPTPARIGIIAATMGANVADRATDGALCIMAIGRRARPED
jgi:hypothetical protein